MKDTIQFVASAVFVVLLVLILGYLTYIPVPETNRDLIITILSVLLGGAAAAMPNLFGSRDSEKEKLLTRVLSLEQNLQVLQAEYTTLKDEYDRLTEMLISRHVVAGEGIISQAKKRAARNAKPKATEPSTKGEEK